MIQLLLLANGETNVLMNSDWGCVGNTCEHGVVTVWNDCVFQEIHNLQSKKTDVGELEKEREEAMQRLQVRWQYIYLLFCEMCTGVLRLTRHVAVTLSNTLVLVGSFLPSLWAVGKKQATISLLTLFFNLLYTATLRTVHPTSLSQGSQHYCHVLS